jgi:hypothetical protein
METEEMKALGYTDGYGTRVFTWAELKEYERIKHEVTMSTGIPHGRSMAVRISDFHTVNKCNCSCHSFPGEINTNGRSRTSMHEATLIFPAHFVPKS